MSQQTLSINEIQKKLRAFKLSGMVDTLEMRLREAGDDKLSYSEFLGLLLEDEVNKRTDNSTSFARH